MDDKNDRWRRRSEENRQELVYSTGVREDVWENVGEIRRRDECVLRVANSTLNQHARTHFHRKKVLMNNYLLLCLYLYTYVRTKR